MVLIPSYNLQIFQKLNMVNLFSIIMQNRDFINKTMNNVLSGLAITFEEAERLLFTGDLVTLAACANTITRTFNKDKVDVETLLNAKSGRCPEDCSFCAQSSFYDSRISKYPLLPPEVIIQRARSAKENGASSFCLVCAYREPPEKDFCQICETICAVKKKVDIDINVSLGFMTHERARKLKSLGVKRYNHNLEAAESYFSKICRTHDFADRINTARIVKEEGLELCCGGIIGMGETPQQRLELGFSIATLKPEEVPINILVAQQGTPLAHSPQVQADDAIRTIAVWRFIMPETILKIAGGREVYFKDKGRLALKAGANGLITGGYLTVGGNSPCNDLQMIHEIGLRT
ncbi:MAG TPA: biotin synthase BioB [Candidatus Bathyarchaeia archaeon]|nr:biotin synthase BioB [Candidatus Bathyarchaeia archaeon]